jgi:hypothetical protein
MQAQVDEPGVELSLGGALAWSEVGPRLRLVVADAAEDHEARRSNSRLSGRP